LIDSKADCCGEHEFDESARECESKDYQFRRESNTSIVHSAIVIP
jgi:hypothetical protein